MKKKHKRHGKLPAGFGSVRYLGEGRSRPYAVYPKSRDGKRGKAICYVKDWYTGVAVLAAWNTGRYEKGLEDIIGQEVAMAMGCSASGQCGRTAAEPEAALDAFCSRVLGYFREAPAEKTLGEVFELYYSYKYGPAAARRLSKSAGAHARSSFGKLGSVSGRTLDSLTVDELQSIVDGVGLRRSAVGAVIVLLKGLYRFALARDLCSRDPAQYLRMPDVKESVRRQDFTDEELAVLWSHSEDPMVRMVLIMCYSGFRYSAYPSLETDLKAGYFKGGIKTAAGKGRVVPIHSAIRPLVEQALRGGTYTLGLSQYQFIRRMSEKLEEIGVDVGGRHHTPHCCRHTFSRLCESYGVREADRKRMMGHSFGSDITNGVYGHRSLEELRAEIEKIKVPEGC